MVSPNTIKLPNHSKDTKFQCRLYSNNSLRKVHTITITRTDSYNHFSIVSEALTFSHKLVLSCVYLPYHFCFCMTRRLCLPTILECPYLEVRLILQPHIITIPTCLPFTLYSYLLTYLSSTNI